MNLSGDNTFQGILSVSGTGTLILSGKNDQRIAGASGLTAVTRGAKLQLQANNHNIVSGISYALSAEQSGATANQPLVLHPGSQLELRSEDDVAFAGFNNFGGLGNATVNIDVNRISSGTGHTLTIAPGYGFATGNTNINVTGGNGYKLGTGQIYHVQNNNQLTFNPTTADLVIGNGTIILVGNVVTLSPTAYSLATTANNSNTFNFTGTSTGSVVTGAILNSVNAAGAYGTGVNTITKSGTGTWTFQGVNTYTGSTTVNAGTLTIASTGSLGSVATPNTYPGNIILNGGTFNYATSAATAATTTFSGSISGSGAAFVHSGTGDVILTGSSPFSGTTTINGGGKLRVNGIMPGSPITLTSGTLDGIGTAGNVTVANNAANIVANGSGTTNLFTLGNLNFAGKAVLNLNKVNSLAAPALSVGNLTTTPVNGKVTLNILTAPVWSSGSVYRLVSYNSFTGSTADFTLGTVVGLGVRQTPSLGNTGSSSGFLTLSIAGDAPVWTGAKSGAWTTAAVGSPFNWKLQNVGTGTEFLTNDQAIFDDTATGTTALSITDNTVAPTSVAFNNATKDYSISSSNGNGITSGALSKKGAAALTINTANTYSGGTTLVAGTLNINNSSAIGTGNLTITGGTLGNTSGADIALSTNNTQSWNGDLSYNSTKNLDLGTGAVNLGGNRTVTVNGLGTLTVGGAISGVGVDITKAGSGTLVLGGANAYSGTTTISGGAIQLNNTNALQFSTVNNTVANGLRFGSGVGLFNLGGLSGSVDLALADLSGAPVSLNVGSGGANTTYSGKLTGDGSFTKIGTGTFTLTGSNTYTGATILNGGTLNVGNSTALGGTATIVFGGGTLQYSANNQFDYSSQFSSNLNQAVRVDTNGQNVTWATGLTSTGGTLTKLGAGTLTMTGANSFTGAITVNGGTLILSGDNSARPNATANSVVVNAGGILQLQANTGNTAGGVSTALSTEQTANQPLILNTGSTLQLRSNDDVTFAGANNFGGLGNATIGIDVNNNGSGTGKTITISPTNFNVSNTTINITGGNGYKLRLPSITGVAANTTTLNPTTANVSVGVLTGTVGAHVFALSGSSTGNVVTDGITDGTAGTTTQIIKSGSGTWTLSGSASYTGSTNVDGGTLAMGAASAASPTSALVLGGGKFDTGGFNQFMNTLTLSNTSAIDMGGGTSVLNFADSSAAAWSVGSTLSVLHWSGTANTGGGSDQLIVGAANTALTAAQVAKFHFQGFNGSKILASGEVVPVSVSTRLFGDFDGNSHVNAADIATAMSALTDLNAFKASKSLSNDDLLNIADMDLSGNINNADLQGLLNYLKGGGGSVASAVPEPCSLALLGFGSLFFGACIRKRRDNGI